MVKKVNNYCYELLSLPGWSRAEALKVMFHLAGQPFEDIKLSIPEWRRFKEKSSLPPEVRLPLLRIKGNYTIAGSTEIGRLLARHFGFYAESTIEQREIEEIVRYVEALHVALLPIIRDTLARDIEKKMVHWQEFKSEVLLPILDFMARRLGEKTFFVGERVGSYNYLRLTWADICLAELLSRFVHLFDPDFLKPYPTLDSHRSRLEERPELAQLLANRSNVLF